MKKGRERSKSAGHILHHIQEHKEQKLDVKTKDENDIRSVCRKVSLYITHQWRDVCEELGVAEAKLDSIVKDHEFARRSEIAYQGLCLWIEKVGRSASIDKLLKAIRACGLQRAEDEIKSIQEKRHLPCFAKPSMIESHHKDSAANKHAKQKALADRLSRPKSKSSDTNEVTPPKEKHGKRRPSYIAENMNPLLLVPNTSKHSDLCEVRIKVTLKGVQRKGPENVVSTRDDFPSTKDDYKHTCHNFVKMVSANQKTHFNQLKNKLDIDGLAVIGLDKIGFNIQLFVICFSLGSLEILLQCYHTGRLKKIMHSCLVTQNYLDRLGADDLELSVTIEEGMTNQNREITVNRYMSGDTASHPIDEVQLCKYLLDDDAFDDRDDDFDPELAKTFEIGKWHKELKDDIDILSERLQTFLSSVKDFLLILRISKPAGKTTINCLQDIIDGFHHIQSAKHLHEGIHVDVFEEYLAIINKVRLKVRYIHKHDCFISFDESMDDRKNDLFHNLLHNLDVMLEPEFEFQQVVDEMEMLEPGLTLQTLLKEIESSDNDKVVLSSIEKDVYGGCLCYIPALVGKLMKLSDVFDMVVTFRKGGESLPRNRVVLSENLDMTSNKGLVSLYPNNMQQQTVN